MEECDVSVIIPIYKGIRYVEFWKKKIEANYRCMQHSGDYKIEVIFINDYPEETLNVTDSVYAGISIRGYNLKVNQGIHGARVYGVDKAIGRYIVMIDQDDMITDDYLISQLEAIGSCDGVVCNGYKEQFCMNMKRKIYSNVDKQRQVVHLMNYVALGNSIISPGQVMLKRDSIPELWMRNVLKNNGADDFLLWVLMLADDKKFEINQNCLYVHIGHAFNTSNDYVGMKMSELETIDILEKECVLSAENLKILKNRSKKDDIGNKKFLKMVHIYDLWMYLKNRNAKISDFLIYNNIHKIVIYGMGYIGSRLLDELSGSNIQVLFGLDQEGDAIQTRVPVYRIGEDVVKNEINDADIVIVTSVNAKEEVENDVKKISNVPVILFEEIIVKMIDGL